MRSRRDSRNLKSYGQLQPLPSRFPLEVRVPLEPRHVIGDEQASEHDEQSPVDAAVDLLRINAASNQQGGSRGDGDFRNGPAGEEHHDHGQ